MTTTPVFELDAFAVRTPDGPILRVPALRLRDRAITAIMGPVATGKSLLLRALAGVRPPEPVHYDGTLRFDGGIAAVDRDAARDGVLWIGQSKTGGDLSVSDVLVRADGARAVLLDEIERRVPPEDRSALVDGLRDVRRSAAVVVVTHDLAFARELADEVHLVCAGAVVASADAPRFFDVPPTALAARFVRNGNCWPDVSAPPLPSSFRWVIDGQLAGTARPGLLRDVDEDLASMALAGITEIVTLTEEPPPIARLRSFGFASRHFSIPDMGVPAVGPTLALCTQIVRSVESGERVAVHCNAGLGRTGTILASVLVVRDGIRAAEAIRRVRTVETRMIQNRAQEYFVEALAEAQGR